MSSSSHKRVRSLQDMAKLREEQQLKLKLNQQQQQLQPQLLRHCSGDDVFGDDGASDCGTDIMSLAGSESKRGGGGGFRRHRKPAGQTLVHTRELTVVTMSATGTLVNSPLDFVLREMRQYVDGNGSSSNSNNNSTSSPRHMGGLGFSSL
jgi:hypothetical protein